MEIRLASPADLDALAGLYLHNHVSTYRDLLPDYVSGLSLPYCREKWAAFLSGPDNRVWTAFEGGALDIITALGELYQFKHASLLLSPSPRAASPRAASPSGSLSRGSRPQSI